MKKANKTGMVLTGLCAGAVNGLIGTGGGMVLIPLLTKLTDTKENEIFPSSVSIILPICVVSLFLSCDPKTVTFCDTLPYLLGSAAGGIICGFIGDQIPVKWLHIFLGIVMIWGGIRYLC